MRCVIVTGAGKGLGKAITASLILDGFSVVAVDWNKSLLTELTAEFGDTVQPFHVDVSNSSAVESFFRQIETLPVYGLINNAGIYLGKGIFDYSGDEISRVLNVNLTGAILFSKFFGAWLCGNQSEGVIINISSSSIYGGSDPVYSSSKAGLIGLTKACAKCFSPHIRVNAVAPGIVETDMMSHIPSAVLEGYRNSELIKQPLVSKDIANTILFLLSDRGSHYSGAVFDLNNGYHL